MEGEGSKGKKKSGDNEEISRIMNAAVDRFLKSPTRPTKTLTEPIICVDD